MASLFDLAGGSDESGGELETGQVIGDTWKVNREYAEKFEERKRKEEAAKLRDALKARGIDPDAVLKKGRGDSDSGPDDDSDSDSESEDEFGDALTPGVDAKIAAVLAKVKSKDPSIYKKDAKFFESSDSEDDATTATTTAATASEKKGKKGKKNKVVTLEDHVRESLLKHGAEAFEEDEDSDDPRASSSANKQGAGPGTGSADGDLSVVQMQEKLRSDFMKQANSSLGESKDSVTGGRAGKHGFADDGLNDDDDDGTGGLLVKRAAATSAEGDSGFDEWNREQDEEVRRARGEELAALSRYFDPTQQLTEEDKFLRDFITKRGWVDPEEAAEMASRRTGAVPSYDQIVGDIEDSAAVDAADNFEAVYNFRFEEPGSGQLQGHARTVEGSVRQSIQAEKRREKRLARKARKEEEARRQEEEIRRLEEIKRAEVEAQLSKVAKAAGQSVDPDLLSKIDLDADFDPEAWDKQMGSLFGDDFYDEEDGELAAHLQGDVDADAADELAAAIILGDDRPGRSVAVPSSSAPSVGAGAPDGPTPMDTTTAVEPKDDGNASDSDGGDAGGEGGEGGVVGGGGPADRLLRRKMKKAERKKAKKAAAKAAAKALAEGDGEVAVLEGPSSTAAAINEAKKVLKEYRNMEKAPGERSDMLSMKFHYTRVKPDNFGLSLEDMLFADERELRQIASLKLLAPYREEDDPMLMRHRRKVSRSGGRLVVPSLEQDRAEAEEARKKRRRPRRAGAKGKDSDSDGEGPVFSTVASTSTAPPPPPGGEAEGEPAVPKKKGRNKKRGRKAAGMDGGAKKEPTTRSNSAAPAAKKARSNGGGASASDGGRDHRSKKAAAKLEGLGKSRAKTYGL